LFDLQNIIKKYPDEVNKLITMKVEGYSTKECADEFNTNENSLKVRWHRIKNKLKAEFE
jgi:DNA-directed RNA polymerase specialized sigma24 family protein